MAFDAKAFNAARFEDRVEAYPVPDLGAFFPEGEEAVFRVRGLTGPEIALVRAAEDRRRASRDVLEKTLSGVSSPETVAAMLKQFGLDDGLTPDYSGKLEVMRLGCVEPKLEKSTVVRIAENFPIVFYEACRRILELSGKGRMGEPSASGATPPSGPASPSAPGEDSAGGSGSSSK